MIISRRRALFGACASLPLALAACSVTSQNGVTTFTLNVATVNAYAQALKSAGTGLLGISVISAALGPVGTAAVQLALTGISDAAAAINTEANGAVSVSFTSSSVPAAITSLEQSASNLLSAISAGVSSLKGLPSDVQTYIGALQTIVALVIGFTSTISAPLTVMPADRALAILSKPLARR